LKYENRRIIEMTTSAQGIAYKARVFKGKVRRIDIQLIDDQWKPLSGVSYKHTSPDGHETGSKKLANEGYLIKEDTKPNSWIKVDLFEERLEKERKYVSNSGPLPSLDLRNHSDGGNGSLQKGDKRTDLVNHLQTILYELGFDLGITGSNENGVDGDFGSITEQVVRDYQTNHKNWEGKNLIVDGKVGPQTSDALNRSMVGIWYDTYDAPSKLVQNQSLKTVTASIARKGLKL
jgi:hypothetical protein